MRATLPSHVLSSFHINPTFLTVSQNSTRKIYYSKNSPFFKNSPIDYRHFSTSNPVPKSNELPLQSVRGMHDLFGLDLDRHQYTHHLCRQIAANYGYHEIQTPIVEFEALFLRTLGLDSDVVQKEMYAFSDRSNRRTLALRPECTASVIRAFIQHQFHLPQRLYYLGPMFRYERPQRGRSRQFYQFGIEHLGVNDVMSDMEAIEMADHLLQKLGIRDKATLLINTLGDAESRKRYQIALAQYLEKCNKNLSKISKLRLERGNILRVLDSKEAQDWDIILKAPKIGDYLTPSARQRMDSVLKGLQSMNMTFRVEPRLVRGLDYYNDTCFEYVESITEGKSGDLGTSGKEEMIEGKALIAGGRYDQLVQDLGGQPTPGIGWAAGIERIAMLVNNGFGISLKRPIMIIAMRGELLDEMRCRIYNMASKLRFAGETVIFGYEPTLAKQLKQANKEKCKWCILFGIEEMNRHVVLIKDMDTGEQEEEEMEEAIRTILCYSKKAT